ncbi:MAG: RNA 2',3'-cyclic phosphodiesterase [Thermodesulfovibrionales bacterium]
MALRCFIAVTLPGPLKKAVGEVMAKLKESGADIKWVPYENLHLTLKFLGATSEEVVDEIKGALYKKLSRYAAFYIRIGGVGYFPGGRNPRVIWIGIEEQGSLADISRDVEEVMLKFGYPREARPFSPHLTIGRVRSPKRVAEVIKRLDEFRTMAFDEFEVKGVTLMKSELKPGGAEYTGLAEISLEGEK